MESSFYKEEEQIEDEVQEEILALFLIALVNSSKSFTGNVFTFELVSAANQRLSNELSSVVPVMNSQGSEAIKVGLNRTIQETSLSDLTFNFSNERFVQAIRETFEDNLDQFSRTNEKMVQELLRIAGERGWSDTEIIKRLKRYWGLTAQYINTVIKLEDALRKEGATNKVIQSTVQKKVDQLITWRTNLTASQIATEVTERSKAVAFAEMFNQGDIPSDYIKEAIAVLDENTTQVCMSSHRTTAELNGNFPNGFFAPPFNSPVHPCRSTIRIIKRPET